LGISIRFYYQDHLPPHFHAVYGEFEAQIGIGTHAVLASRLPGRVLGLVLEWAELHRNELERRWDWSGAGIRRAAARFRRGSHHWFDPCHTWDIPAGRRTRPSWSPYLSRSSTTSSTARAERR
jgi:hypothetical protein